MKVEKAVSAIWAFALSGLLSVSAVMCMVTAFHMQVDMTAVVLSCIIAAAVCSVCFTLPFKLLPPGLGALALGYLWQSGALIDSVEALLNRLTRQYDRAYSWGIIRWGFRTADEMEPTMVVILCVLGIAIAMAASWSVCKGESALPGILLSALCAATCFVVTDTVPDTVWLYLLLLVTVTLLLTAQVRQQDAARGNRLSLYLVPMTALALLVLLAAVPRNNYHGQAAAERLVDVFLNSDPVELLRGDRGDYLSGDTGVDLTDVGYRQESNTEVMTVTVDFDGILYLRGRAMGTYDGKGWHDDQTGNAPDWSRLGWPETLQKTGRLIVTTRYAHRMLYTPYYLSVAQMYDVHTGIENRNGLTTYAFDCYQILEYKAPDSYYLSPDIQPKGWSWERLSLLTRLPDGVKNWAEPLARQITGDVASPYHRAQAIADYVRNSAVYDTATARMPIGQKDFARWFLENSDTGYCVHFASAAAVLLQASGIPARYVTGYMLNAQAGQTVPVQAKQAHAWVEYWLPGFGWTILEATPADLRQPTQPETTEQATLPTDQQPVESTPAEQDTPNQSQSQTDGTGLTVLLWVAAVLFVVGIAQGQRSLRLLWRQRRYDRRTINAKALLRWQEVTRLSRLTGQIPAEALFGLAQKAKYSQYTLTAQELAQFDAYIAAATQVLKKRSIFHRFYYCFILAVY